MTRLRCLVPMLLQVLMELSLDPLRLVLYRQITLLLRSRLLELHRRLITMPLERVVLVSFTKQ